MRTYHFWCSTAFSQDGLRKAAQKPLNSSKDAVQDPARLRPLRTNERLSIVFKSVAMQPVEPIQGPAVFTRK